MKRFTCLILITILLLLVGCPNDGTESQTSDDNGGSSSAKITSLQDVIDKAETDAVIDLSKAEYSGIKNWSATVNKSLTIKNGSDLKGETLTVTTDGVVLNNIKKASVTTNSSLKISGSTLNRLSIEAVSDSTSSSSQISGRGGNSRTDKAPTVEVSGTIVSSEITLGISGAYLAVDNLDAKTAEVNLNAANTKLSIAGESSKIHQIKTDKICQLILEDGTSDNIPTPNVTDNGELTQIDMTATGQMKLLALTPMSGLTTVVKKDESIDFSSVVVLGTYQADDGVTVFKAGGLSYNLTETFSKLEKKFTIKIGTNEVYKNGANVSFDWSGLDAEEHSATIDKEYDPKDGSYTAYSFNITVTEEAKLPTPVLKSIEVYLGANIGTTYLEGDTLDLGNLLVMGVYEAGSITYKNILTDYTLSKQNGTVLTTSDTAVTVTIPNETEKKGTINLTVHPAVLVTFQIAQGQTIVSRIEKDTKVTAPQNIARIGYTFGDWYSDVSCSAEYNFDTVVSANTTVYAKWYTNASHIITYHLWDGTDDVMAEYYEFEDVSLDMNMTKTGFTLTGWYEDAQCSGTPITGWRPGEKAENVNVWAKWSEKWDTDATGDFVYGDIVFLKTSLVTVTDKEVTIDGTDDNWSSYLESGAPNDYKGAFIGGRTVKLSPYKIGKYEVTKQLYEYIMNSGKNYGDSSGDTYPALNMSWYTAITFCNKLSLLMDKEPCYSVKIDGNEIDWEHLVYSDIPASSSAANINSWAAAECDITKNGYRLPTEAEWEFAARGGDQSAEYWKYAYSGAQSTKLLWIKDSTDDEDYATRYSDSDEIFLTKDVELAKYAWYRAWDEDNQVIHPVGEKLPNELGLFDMSGNVFEWCQDIYHADVTRTDSGFKNNEGVVINPIGLAAGSDTDRVLRGGTSRSYPYSCSVSNRTKYFPFVQYYTDGLRLVCKE